MTLRTLVFDLRSGRLLEQRMAWQARLKGPPPAPPARSAAAVGGSLRGIYAIQWLGECVSTSGAFAPQGFSHLRHRYFY